MEEKQNLNVNQEDLVEDKDKSEDEGANHMQLKRVKRRRFVIKRWIIHGGLQKFSVLAK